MAKNLNRGNVAALSLLVPWGFGVVGAIVGNRYEQEGYEKLVFVVAIVLGLLVSIYCAYLYVRDKERHWFWALASVVSMWGWIVLWVLPDRSSK